MSTIKVMVEGVEQGQEKREWGPLVIYIGLKKNDHRPSGIGWDYATSDKLRDLGYTNIITITAQRED